MLRITVYWSSIGIERGDDDWFVFYLIVGKKKFICSGYESQSIFQCYRPSMCLEGVLIVWSVWFCSVKR